MKTIGLIGGMSWESTAVYYRRFNQLVHERLGGLHSAQLLLWSFDFATIAQLQKAEDWDAGTEHMITAARRLERGGADIILICTNTMHKMADAVAQAVEIPLLHIGDALAKGIHEAQVRRPLLLATRYTMEEDFYRGYLSRAHGIEAVIPPPDARTVVHDVIYDELCRGIIEPTSKEKFLSIVKDAHQNGTDGVILGCTEVGLLIAQDDLPIPVFDTTELHVQAGVSFMLDE